MWTDEPKAYVDLITAIVLQAREDVHQSNDPILRRMGEDFVRSEWFQMLAGVGTRRDVNPERVIEIWKRERKPYRRPVKLKGEERWLK